MKRLVLLIFITVSLSLCAQAQRRVHESSALFGSVSACSTGGPNSTFTSGRSNGARQLTYTVDFTVFDKNGTVYLADHARIEIIAGSKVDDDSLMILLSGIADTCSTSVYLDTVYVPIAAGKTTSAMFTPSLTGNTYEFPLQGRLSIANADSGNTGQFPYFGEVADTNIWTARLILWHELYSTSANTITISDYQLDSDTTSWDATKTNIADMTEDADSSSWLATKTNITANAQQDADTSTWDATKTNLTVKQAYTDTTTWDATKTYVTGLGYQTAALAQEDADSSTWDATRTWTLANSQADADTTTWDATKTNIAGKTDDTDSTTWLSTKTNDALKLNVADSTGGGYATQTDISESVLEGFLDLQDLQGAVTDAQVPDNITITETGDISSVVAGDGLTGGATSGAATVDVAVDFDGAIETVDDSLNVKLDGTTLAKSASGLKVNAVGDAQIDEIKSTWCDSVGNDGLLTQTQAVAGYQPLEATLTDIADGTIAENLVNTANPWADAEIASSATWTAKQDGEATLTDLADGNLAEAMIFTGDLAIPLHDGGTADAVREIDYDDGKAALYGYGGARGQLAAINKALNFAIDNPLHLTADTTILWMNNSGSTFTIDSVFTITRGSVDDFDYSLIEIPLTTGASTLIEAITVSTETGTSYRSNSATAIDHAAIETGMGIGFKRSADSTNSCTMKISGRITD